METFGETLLKLLMKLLEIVILVGIGLLVAWIFYYLKRRDLFGGFIGATVVGLVGALLGGFLLDQFLATPVNFIIDVLVRKLNVNIIAAFVGAYIALFIMNKLNHDRERHKY